MLIYSRHFYSLLIAELLHLGINRKILVIHSFRDKNHLIEPNKMKFNLLIFIWSTIMLHVTVMCTPIQKQIIKVSPRRCINLYNQRYNGRRQPRYGRFSVRSQLNRNGSYRHLLCPTSTRKH